MVQAALVGFVALILAFGLTLAVGRYEARRDAIVDEANVIGTTYLRAETLIEPVRAPSLRLLRQYTDDRIALSDAVPDARGSVAPPGEPGDPTPTVGSRGRGTECVTPVECAAPLRRDAQRDDRRPHTRLAALRTTSHAVMYLQIGISALAFGVLGLYLALLGRGVLPPLIGAVMVAVLLLVIFDLDRPHRGFITVPSAPLVRAGALDGPAPGGGRPRDHSTLNGHLAGESCHGVDDEERTEHGRRVEGQRHLVSTDPLLDPRQPVGRPLAQHDEQQDRQPRRGRWRRRRRARRVPPRRRRPRLRT